MVELVAGDEPGGALGGDHVGLRTLEGGGGDPLGLAGGTEEHGRQVRVGDDEPAGVHVRVAGRPSGQAQALAQLGLGEEHAAALAAAVRVVVPAVAVAVSDHRVAQDALVGDLVDVLELPQQLAEGLDLAFGQRPVVVADHLDPDRHLVEVLRAVPHAQAGVPGEALPLDVR
jgi:hypothetical protein